MRTFEDRVKQFYREFPDLRPFVTFQSKELSASIEGDDDEVSFHEQHLSDTEKDEFRNLARIEIRYVFQDEDYKRRRGAVICLDGDTVMAKRLHGMFNLVTANVSKIQCKELESDFAYYHEAGHVLSHLDKKSVKYNQIEDLEEGLFPSDITKLAKDDLREECFTDSYAALRTIQDYGAKGISFMKFIADKRILDYEDSEHLTTFSIDRSIRAAVKLMKAGELKNKTPQELYDMAQKIADQDEFLLERRNDGLNLMLTKYNPDTLEEEIDREGWLYSAWRSLEVFENNDVEQTAFSSAVKDRFNMAVHRTFDLTNHENLIFSEEQVYNGPWSDANAKYLHALDGNKVSGQSYSKKDLDEKEHEVTLYSKSLLRGLGKGMSDDAVMMNYNKIKKIDDRAFLNAMRNLTRQNGEDQLRVKALEMLSNPRKFAKMYLDAAPVARKNRLAKMNERKVSAVKPSTM